jgi:hypothetical protein
MTRQLTTKRKEEGSLYVVKAGLPLILFCGLGVWVVSSGIEGRNKERDAFQGRMSKCVSWYSITLYFSEANFSFWLFATDQTVRHI